MSKVITFSRVFPAYHPKAGQPTYFVEKLLKSTKTNWFKDYYFPMLCENNKKLKPSELSEFVKSFNDGITDMKYHTIRGGHRFNVGDKFSPRVWSGKPYNSKQIILHPDIEIKRIYDFKITTESDDGENDWSYVEFLGKYYTVYGYGEYDDDMMVEIAKNDGLSIADFYDWFLTGRTKNQKLRNEPKVFEGQIICWSDNINYNP